MHTQAIYKMHNKESFMKEKDFLEEILNPNWGMRRNATINALKILDDVVFQTQAFCLRQGTNGRTKLL